MNEPRVDALMLLLLLGEMLLGELLLGEQLLGEQLRGELLLGDACSFVPFVGSIDIFDTLNGRYLRHAHVHPNTWHYQLPLLVQHANHAELQHICKPPWQKQSRIFQTCKPATKLL